MRYETFSFAPLTSHSLERRQSHSIAIIIINCLFCVSWLWQPLVTANTDFISPPTLHLRLKLGSSNYYYLLQSHNICLALEPSSKTGYVTFLIYWALSLKNIICLDLFKCNNAVYWLEADSWTLILLGDQQLKWNQCFNF